MSFISNEERLKLRARRFNIYEHSSVVNHVQTEDNYVYKQGFKRTISDDNETTSIKRKKDSSNNREPMASTKNLANKRLQNLKQRIQDDLQSKNTNKPSTAVSSNSNSTNNPNEKKICDHLNSKNSFMLENEKLINLVRSDFSEKDKDFFENKDKNFATQTMKKNAANERLKNIKRRLTNPDNNPSTSVVSNKDLTENSSKLVASPHSFKLKNENNVTCGIKRNINRITNSDDEDLENSSKRLATSQMRLTSTKVHNSSDDFGAIKNPCNLTKSKQNIVNKETRDTNKANYYANVDILKDTVNNSDNVLSVATTSQVSDTNNGKLPETDNACKTSYDLSVTQNVTSSKESISHLSPLLREKDFCKMVRTASWILNHQEVHNVNTSLENSNSSLKVNVDESRSRINFDETEDMEWANAEPDDEVIGVNINCAETQVPVQKKEKLKDICIVVDTNVFISGLSKIRDIIDMKVTGSSQLKPIIYIPWMVLTELDFMKDTCKDSKFKKNITNSLRFIQDALKQKHPRLIGEAIRDVEKQKYIGKSPDDKILACCFQVSEKYKHVILVSNDVNLKNRAMVNDIAACSANEIMMKIMRILSKNDKFKKISHKMGILCSSVICDCAKEAYGDIWSKMGMLSCPPWSLAECLKRFKKYWDSVFREKLLKQFMKTVEELLHLLESNKCICDDSEDFVKFMKLCITLCIFLKDIEECRGFVENTLNDITKIA